jgi:hypothetical protein
MPGGDIRSLIMFRYLRVAILATGVVQLELDGGSAALEKGRCNAADVRQ